MKCQSYFSINPFYAISLFLFPLKTQGNLCFFCFCGSMEKEQWHKLGHFPVKLTIPMGIMQLYGVFLIYKRLQIDSFVFHKTDNANVIDKK